MDYQKSKTGILAHWGNTEVTSTAVKILDFLETTDKKEIGFEDISQFLGRDVDANILTALTILTTSEWSILRSRGYLLDENDERYDLTYQQMSKVIGGEGLTHPRTGKPVHDPAKHMYVVFTVI